MENEILSLLDKIRQGDEAAFAELADRYKAMTDAAVYRFSRSFDSDKEDGSHGIDDLRQDAAMALYKAAVTYEPYETGKGKSVSFGLYAKICVNNALISVLRKYKSRKKKGKGIKPAPPKPVDPLERLISGEKARELLKQTREVLSAYEKEVFDSYVAGGTVGEIAERLKVEEKSVSNALYRVKVKIKELLKNQ